MGAGNEPIFKKYQPCHEAAAAAAADAYNWLNTLSQVVHVGCLLAEFIPDSASAQISQKYKPIQQNQLYL